MFNRQTRKVMKTLKTTLAIVAMTFCTLVATARPMSYATMHENARFLTDRMAYTLGLRGPILDDLYCINYDYIYGVNEYLDDVAMGYYYNDYMDVVYARDRALRRLLSLAQWNMLVQYDYFYRPISFANNVWRFLIYSHDNRHNHFYYDRPRYYNTYHGGNHFHGMRPVAAHKPNHRPDNNFRPNHGGNNKPNGNFRPNNGGNHNNKVDRPSNNKVERPSSNGNKNNGKVDRSTSKRDNKKNDKSSDRSSREKRSGEKRSGEKRSGETRNGRR